ncbi:hypothetical protein AU476_19230 [Cupriavidus sp. UYMSc13B]|nr:hypothetical protein AU476_19230 [Cupriavidus sp. UYMSc13B]
MANDLHLALGMVENPSKERSWLAMYQKIERTGKTSERKARKLADVLGVSVAMLKGDEEINQIEILSRLVHERLDNIKKRKGSEVTLQRIADFVGLEVSELLLPECRELVNDVARIVETERLSSKSDRLQLLAEILDISIEKLRLPISVNGLWWLCLADVEGRVVSIFDSHLSMIDAIKKQWTQWPLIGLRHTSTFIKVYNIGSKTRIEAWDHHLQRRKSMLWCEFSKCDIDNDGMHWLPLQEWDRFLLERDLNNFIFCSANVLEVQGRRIPSSPSRLFLRVSSSTCDPETWKWKSAGERKLPGQQIFEEMPLRHGGEYSQTNSEDLLQLHNMEWGLLKTLHPFLKTASPERWKIERQSFGIQIELSGKWKQHQYAAEPVMPLKRFYLELMWSDEDGKVCKAPWREHDMKRLTDDIKNMVVEPLPQWMAEKDILPFEPAPDS